MAKLDKLLNTAAFTLLFYWLCVSLLLADQNAMSRQQMLQLIEQDVKETRRYLQKEQLDPRVIRALAKVPRHEFVPEEKQSAAYLNRPLGIGHGQTISQPYIVAIMTDLLNLAPTSKVLELGTGSGYQAAILSELVAQVYSIEIIKPLAEQAAARLKRLGYDNVQVKVGDGFYGWEEHAPYDAIIVTAADSKIPPPLIKQLKVGGSMIIPVGESTNTHQLLLVTKQSEDQIVSQEILPVRFVPLTGEH
jgi:protein-L-isoaspartate(D-aspartate) O-methyltransferase